MVWDDAGWCGMEWDDAGWSGMMETKCRQLEPMHLEDMHISCALHEVITNM